MKIETKFDIRENVYVMHDNRVEEFIIEDIDISITSTIDAGDFGIRNYGIREVYHLKHKNSTKDGLKYISPSHIFKTKQELLNSL